MGHYLALTLLLITNATSTFSFSTGAPQSACETLAPNATQHEADPQMSDIPYVLDLSALFDPTLNQMAYTPNTTYSSMFGTKKILQMCNVRIHSTHVL